MKQLDMDTGTAKALEDELKSYYVCTKAFCDELRLYCEKKLFCNIDVEIPMVEL